MNKSIHRWKEIYEFSQNHSVKEAVTRFKISNSRIHEIIAKYKRHLELVNYPTTDYRKIYILFEYETVLLNALYRKGYNSVEQIVDLFQNHFCEVKNVLGLNSAIKVCEYLIKARYSINKEVLIHYHKNYHKIQKSTLIALAVNCEIIKDFDTNYISKEICNYIIINHPECIKYIKDIIDYFKLDIDKIQLKYKLEQEEFERNKKEGRLFPIMSGDFDGEIINLFDKINKGDR